MKLTAVLTEQWPSLNQTLLTVRSVEVTGASLVILAVFLVLAALIRRPVGRLTRRLLSARIDDDRLLNFLSRLVQVAASLLTVGLGLELGGLVTFLQFLDVLHGVLNGELFTIGATPVSLTTILTVVVIFFLSSWLSRLTQAAIRRAMSLRLEGTEQGTIGVMERLSHYLVLSLGLGVGLQTAGVDLSALFAAGAVFAVGIGFAMQNIAQNFVSGIIVMVERVIRPGDILEVEGLVVRVEEMGIRSTVVRTLSDEHLIVPNSTLAQNTIKNFTLKDASVRLRVMVGVAYESDLRQVHAVLLQAAGQVEGQVEGQPPAIRLKDFGTSSVDFEVSIWIQDPWQRDRYSSDLRFAIWWSLEDAGVVIAFPQLDVHFDTVPAQGAG